VAGLDSAYRRASNRVALPVLRQDNKRGGEHFPLSFYHRLFNFVFPFDFGHFGESSPPNFCSCLIYQALSPNELGNYIFKQPLSNRWR